MKLTKKQTKDFLRGGNYYDIEQNELIKFEDVDSRFVSMQKWCSIFEVVIKCINTGKCYQYTCYEPATEDCDTSSYYDQELELIEVEPIKEMKEVTTWRKVKHETN